MRFDIIRPARFIIGIIKFFGLWRLDNRWEPIYRAYSYMLHVVFTFLNIAAMWMSVFLAKDLEQFTESLYMALTEAALLTKVINMFIFNREAVQFFEFVEGTEVGLKSTEEETIFQNAHRTFNLVGKFYICASASILGAIVVFGSKEVLPYPAWMPFELNSDTFWYAYMFQFIGMTVTCLCNVSIDMLQCYYMHHISLLYQVIGYRVQGIGLSLEKNLDEEETNKLILKELSEIIKVHQTVKRMTTKCERLTSAPFFGQVLLSALVLCFTGYQLQSTSPMENPGQFVGTADFLLVMGLQIYLPCYYAHQVTLQSAHLAEAFYNSNWVAYPVRSKKLIYLCMTFLHEPVYIKAGKFFNIGIPIFAKTINNAYSYFAVLVRMKN